MPSCSQPLVGQVLVELQGHLVPVVGEGGLAHVLDALQDQLAGRLEIPIHTVTTGRPTSYRYVRRLG